MQIDSFDIYELCERLDRLELMLEALTDLVRDGHLQMKEALAALTPTDDDQ